MGKRLSNADHQTLVNLHAESQIARARLDAVVAESRYNVALAQVLARLSMRITDNFDINTGMVTENPNPGEPAPDSSKRQA